MVPGLTSPGGKLPEKGTEQEAKEGDVVVILAEGKDEACMVGTLEVGSEKMKEVKKGVAIKEGHFLGDGLWKIDLN